MIHLAFTIRFLPLLGCIACFKSFVNRVKYRVNTGHAASMATPTSTMSADPLLSNQRKEYHPGPSNAGSSGSQQDPGLDGHDVDPIAVCGFAIKFPEDATTPERLWQMLLDKRCVSSDFPPERCNPEGFYQKNSRMNTVRDALPATIVESRECCTRHPSIHELTL